MSVAKVAIVGRPNVGKSSIFNWLAGIRLAIVDNMAGVTRDRMTYMLRGRERYFEIVDTGGIGINDVDELDQEIEDQIQHAIQLADLLLFVVDAREGVTGLDETVARRLRTLGKPVLLVANKCDGPNWELSAQEFFRFGLGEPIVVSAKNNRHKERLLEAIEAALPEKLQADESDLAEPDMKIAVVGRRNVGKSTFINTLTNSPRMIVSEVAGTTRDSIDVRFEVDGRAMVAIDTPGLKRGKSIRSDIDFYSDHRAHRSIRHADVVLMFFDCSQQVAKVDKQLCQYIEDHYKPCIFVVNKWDKLSEQMATERWADYLRDQFQTMNYVPIAFITGKDGKNVKKLLDHARMLFKQSRLRVTTGELNRLIKAALERQAPPMISGRRAKIYYATQIDVQPPTIVIKCNDPELFPRTYQRYLLNALRDGLEFGEIPIRIIMETRSQVSESAREGRNVDLAMDAHEMNGHDNDDVEANE